MATLFALADTSDAVKSFSDNYFYIYKHLTLPKFYGFRQKNRYYARK